jgi:hypothetical protein
MRKELLPNLSVLADDSLGMAIGTAYLPDITDEPKLSILNAEIAPHDLNFDEKEFLTLLAGSLSLRYVEKVAIINQIPELSQFQIDSLIEILKDEVEKFAKLEKMIDEEENKLFN